MLANSIICGIMSICALLSDTTISKKDFEKQSLSVEVGVNIPSNYQIPYFIRTLRYGNINTNSFSNQNAIYSKYSILNTKKYSINLESQLLLLTGSKIDGLIPVANLTFFSKNFELYLGRRREIFGLGDSLLTSGFYIWSGNALPIPKIHLGTPGFVPFKFTKSFLALNANFAHGWFGRGDYASGYFLHQKSLYLRFGKIQAPFHFYIGGSHYAQWGGFAPKLIKYNITTPSGALPGSWNDYWNVLLSKNLNETSATNLSLYQVGNQLGTIETMFEYSRNKGHWKAYYQHGIESRGILNNFPDGLYGISFRRHSNNNNTGASMKAITIEFLTTLNQNTQLDPNSNEYYNDDYFNHPLQYIDGWTYQNRVIGTPFITLRADAQARWKSLYQIPDNEVSVKVINNRLWAFYSGSEWGIAKNTQFFTKVSISKNYLSFDKKTGNYGNSVTQFSSFVGITQKLKFLKGTTLSLALAYDRGDLLPSGFGMSSSLKCRVF